VLRIDLLELARLSQELASNPGASTLYQPSWYGMALAGISMGFGAGPLHKIITALEKARKGRVEPES
jgi:hypothetical protein